MSDRSTVPPQQGVWSEAAWWQQAPSLSASGMQRVRGAVPVEWYQFGENILGLEADDVALRQRFRHIYRECAVPSPWRGGVQVRCTLQALPDSPLLLVAFAAPNVIDLVDFALHLFGNRGYVELPASVAGWRLLAHVTRPAAPFLTGRHEIALLDRRQPWQSFVVSYAVNRTFILQEDRLFFHAASVGIRGRGVLLIGSKGTGKTTLSMALASRGHDFLGDEIATVHKRSGEMLPLRRAVSIRPGVRSHGVEARLKHRHDAWELFPDGTHRMRVHIASLFPHAAARPVPLRCAIFLRSFAAHPRLDSFCLTLRHLRYVQPLGCTLWGGSQGHRLMALLAVFVNVRCYFLDVGPPDETAALVESIVEA